MDSLKLTKSRSPSSASNSGFGNNVLSLSNRNKSPVSCPVIYKNGETTSINDGNASAEPITARFSGGDECIDVLFKSLYSNSSTTTLNSCDRRSEVAGGEGADGAKTNLPLGDRGERFPSDVVNTGYNFLLENFFNRKSGLSIQNAGMDVRSLDHCSNDVMLGMGTGSDKNATAAAITDERMCSKKLSEHRLAEVDAVSVAAENYAADYFDPTWKSKSPYRSSPSSDQSERFSRKIFVGGLPRDIEEDEIIKSFRRFGNFVVNWPHNADSKSCIPSKRYTFLVFQNEKSVQQLVASCISADDRLFLRVSSPTIKDMPIQISPWRLSDADYVLEDTMSLDARKTVFVGGVPRPLKAYELAIIMDQLYGEVCYAGIDTDPELKYPKRSGRVSFTHQQSYIAAISARFVHLYRGDIKKRVEVKPYVLDNQMCDKCEGQNCGGKSDSSFCANVTCLQYYCEHCWSQIHSRPGREYHKRFVKERADRPRA